MTEYINIHGDEALSEVLQVKDHPARKQGGLSKDGMLHTLIANHGLLVCPSFEEDFLSQDGTADRRLYRCRDSERIRSIGGASTATLLQWMHQSRLSRFRAQTETPTRCASNLATATSCSRCRLLSCIIGSQR